MNKNIKESDGGSYLLSLNCGTEYVHNSGTRYTHGKMCSDCGRFIAKGTLEYFMTSGHTSIWMALHNRGVAFRRGETNVDLSDELKNLMERLDDRDAMFQMTEDEAQLFMDESYNILKKHNVLDNEATKSLSN